MNRLMHWFRALAFDRRQRRGTPADLRFLRVGCTGNYTAGRTIKRQWP